MYRPEWFPKDNVLTIALNIHMYVMGSYDTMLEDHELNVRALKYTLDNWEKYKIGSGPFDSAVKKVIQTALKENTLKKVVTAAVEEGVIRSLEVRKQL